MKTNVHMKSLAIGLILGVGITLLLGAATAPNLTLGRYQITATEKIGLVLDTGTGEVWSHGFDPNRREPKSAAFFQPKTELKLEK